MRLTEIVLLLIAIVAAIVILSVLVAPVPGTKSLSIAPPPPALRPTIIERQPVICSEWVTCI